MIAETWVYATMLIENEWGRRGTGFLVAREFNTDKQKIFLVTNKHVLHREPEQRKNAQFITCHLNIRDQHGNVVGRRAPIDLAFQDGSKIWKEHPDPEVDVLAFMMTELIVRYPQIERKWAGYHQFADEAKLDELDITIGDEILVIGYPLGLKQGTTNFPLVRQGIIATRIGETLHEEYGDSDGTMRTRVLRGFLIDGGIIPGSSGSPVVLKPVTSRLVKGEIRLGVTPAILLGIVAETRFAPISTEIGDIPSFAGLGLAFDAATIKETIELFFADPS